MIMFLTLGDALSKSGLDIGCLNKVDTLLLYVDRTFERKILLDYAIIEISHHLDEIAETKILPVEDASSIGVYINLLGAPLKGASKEEFTVTLSSSNVFIEGIVPEFDLNYFEYYAKLIERDLQD